MKHYIDLTIDPVGLIPGSRSPAARVQPSVTRCHDAEPLSVASGQEGILGTRGINERLNID